MPQHCYKRRHSSITTASNQIRSLIIMDKEKGIEVPEQFGIYTCRLCKGYHITSHPKKNCIIIAP